MIEQVKHHKPRPSSLPIIEPSNLQKLTHLIRENYLGEFYTDEDKKTVRKNLDVVSNSELEEKVLEIVSNIKKEAVWEPSGPVQSTIGYVEDNTEFVTPMTLQQLADAMFYGKTSGEANIFTGIISDIDEQVSLSKINELIKLDSINNKYDYFSTNVYHTYDFADPTLKYLVVVVPSDYPPLESISVNSQSFGLNAFNYSQFETIDIEKEETKTYDVYVYKQGLATLSTSVTFKFR